MSGEHTPPTPADLPWLGIARLRQAIVSGLVSPVEVTEQALARAEGSGRQLRAFTALDAEGALESARRLEASLRAGGERWERASRGVLCGVPLTVKDLMTTRGIPMTGGSRALGEGSQEDPDALLVARLRRAGAILLGKTNLNEFAYGISGENQHFGQVLNPWNRDFSPGGSSAGSAAAVAAGIGVASVGTDTRGSIRIPASCCSVTGFKPTLGLIPTRGVFPLSRTLDHVGPLGRSVEDVALLLGVMARGPGRGGAFLPPGSGAAPAPGLRLGLPSFFLRDLHGEVEGLVRRALTVLEEAGLVLVPLEIPELEGSLRASAVIAASEALGVHDARIREREEDFGAGVLQRLKGGYAHTALDLVRALELREALLRAYRRAFVGVDLMAGATLPGLPVPVGSPVMDLGDGRTEGVVDASCRLVAPQNMTGVPALSLPCGFSGDGRPVGFQLWGPRGADRLVLSLGRLFQERTPWHHRRPPVD